jgi:hypothetical protein
VVGRAAGAARRAPGGATLYATLARRLWLPDGGALATGAAIGGTLLLELGLPVLLLFPRTRLAGVLLAVPFHVALGLAGYPRFSALCLALLLLFLPPPAPASTSRPPLALHGRDRGTASTPRDGSRGCGVASPPGHVRGARCSPRARASRCWRPR